MSDNNNYYPNGYQADGSRPYGSQPNGSTAWQNGQQGWAQQPQPDVAEIRRGLQPRLSTIIWGVLLLAFAVFMIFSVTLKVMPDPVTWITGALIAGGIALVIIGIAAAARRTP